MDQALPINLVTSNCFKRRFLQGVELRHEFGIPSVTKQFQDLRFSDEQKHKAWINT